MKLKTILKKYMGKDVKLGSANAFVYCSTVNNKTIRELNVLSADELNRLVKVCIDNQSFLRKFDKIWNQRIELRQKEFNALASARGWTPELMAHNHALMMKKIEREKAHDLENKQRLDREFTEYISKYTYFPEREVKEIYPSAFGGTSIIFEGRERGNYWTKEEYEEVNS